MRRVWADFRARAWTSLWTSLWTSCLCLYIAGFPAGCRPEIPSATTSTISDGVERDPIDAARKTAEEMLGDDLQVQTDSLSLNRGICLSRPGWKRVSAGREHFVSERFPGIVFEILWEKDRGQKIVVECQAFSAAELREAIARQ